VSKSREDGSLDVLLVHGFGASIGHFKKNVRALVEAGHNVHALDLLGFGASEKPPSFEYTVSPQTLSGARAPPHLASDRLILFVSPLDAATDGRLEGSPG